MKIYIPKKKWGEGYESHILNKTNNNSLASRRNQQPWCSLSINLAFSFTRMVSTTGGISVLRNELWKYIFQRSNKVKDMNVIYWTKQRAAVLRLYEISNRGILLAETGHFLSQGGFHLQEAYQCWKMNDKNIYSKEVIRWRIWKSCTEQNRQQV